MNATLVGDLTQIPLGSGTVDVAIAWHVLEHIPNDTMVISEIARVLRPGGSLLVSVPIFPMGNPSTREDSTVPRSAYPEHYGHPDHVRACGLDYGERLAARGLVVERLLVRDCSTLDQRRLGLNPNHVVWRGLKM